MSYTHLTEGERYQIQALCAEGLGPTAIGRRLKRCKSAISRELMRNSHSSGYQASHAQTCYQKRLQEKGVERQPWRLVFIECVVPLLAEGWSPEQIAGVFKGDHGYSVSHEWLYQRILKDKREGGTAYRHLRCQKQRKKRYGKPERRGQITNRRSISERPAEVELRQQLGHWEADTIIGTAHKGALVTLVERSTGYCKIQRVNSKEADGVTAAICKMLAPYKKNVHSITFDNGKEFAGHEIIAKRLKTDCYFADPYKSWQRGSNENTNGLIRQYCPKNDSDFTQVSDEFVAEIERKLNHRPRKRLHWKTPDAVFNEQKL